MREVEIITLRVEFEVSPADSWDFMIPPKYNVVPDVIGPMRATYESYRVPITTIVYKGVRRHLVLSREAQELADMYTSHERARVTAIYENELQLNRILIDKMERELWLAHRPWWVKLFPWLG